MSTAANIPSRDFSLYRCVLCGTGRLVPSPTGDYARCSLCTARYPIRHNVLDTTISPSEETIRELKGMALEANMAADQWPDIQLRKLDRLSTFEDCLKQSANVPSQYYQQTLMHFEQAMAELGQRRIRNAVEIGAQRDYPFLKRLRELGAACHAVNVFFCYGEPDEYLEWPEKTLGDMNELPFRDGAFDLVLMSATTHHSPDLDRTIREVHRVLEPGGAAIIISDPLRGWLKGLGKVGPRPARHTMIHENEYSIWEYRKLFAECGFQARFLFSDFYDQKLSTGDIHPDLRFARLSRLLSVGWRDRTVREFAKRHFLLLAQAVFGFPLNTILIKSR